MTIATSNYLDKLEQLFLKRTGLNPVLMQEYVSSTLQLLKGLKASPWLCFQIFKQTNTLPIKNMLIPNIVEKQVTPYFSVFSV